MIRLTKMGLQDLKLEEQRAVGPADRTLRVITAVTWIPAFSFLLPHGIREDAIFPALGLIPMSFSLFFALLSLAGRPRLVAARSVIDLFLAVFLISMLIPSWVSLARGGWYRDSGMTMLGSYGTMMMMINFCIHSWFVLRELPYKRILGLSAAVCPHCHGDLRQRAPPAMSQASSPHSQESYHIVQQGESKDAEEGRVSMVDNEARSSFHDETCDESAPLM